ncbi:hypothetical protein ACFL27_11850 [candidate division CSSED10-310 bacterium]|uniref:VOC domain-containing protein n=1 Tax=candidate division CSSED10-310 bacterium TaxID=2855610 RepID=A0ABV6YXG4_UNCC1
MKATCMVFFQSDLCSFESAVESLSEYGLTVHCQGDLITAGRPGSPQYEITVSRETYVQEEAIEISTATPHAEAMSKCNTRFEIVIDDLDEALDEINTLIEVQSALQEASEGYLFIPWNDTLSAPEYD